MATDPALPTLIDYRHTLYHRVLGRRHDAQFELLDAVLTGPSRATLVRCTLSPAFRRRWPSASDALTDGALDPAAARRLLVAAVRPPASPARAVWAIDGTVWPRPAARTSPHRTWCHQPRAGLPDHGLVAGWEYQWLVAAPEADGSWVVPLEVRRRGPDAGSPTALAITQLRAVLGDRSRRHPGATRPVVTFDSQYDAVQLARAHLAADCLVRLSAKRRFFRAPTPYPGLGTRVRRHGPVLRTWDPATQGDPTATAATDDPDHGRVTVTAWTNLHVQGAHEVPLTVVRVTVERLPKSGKSPEPLWLAWTGATLPEDLLDCWRWYRRRFVIEHAFRFLKQDLGWTTVRLIAPAVADRWTWLLALALGALWLGRALAADARLPWERATPPARISPGRVRRTWWQVLARVGTPAAAPRRRGKSPGRQVGDCPGRRVRQPVVRRAA